MVKRLQALADKFSVRDGRHFRPRSLWMCPRHPSWRADPPKNRSRVVQHHWFFPNARRSSDIASGRLAPGTGNPPALRSADYISGRVFQWRWVWGAWRQMWKSDTINGINALAAQS